MNAPPMRRWLVGAAERIDAALGPARVERIALPPLVDKPGKEGEFCAVQLDDGSVGLAFVLLGRILPSLHESFRSDAAPGMPALDIVRGYAGDDAAQRALGIPVTVLELRPELVREEPGLSVTLDAGRLAGCNKIVATSSLLLNDTFEQVSTAWQGAQAVAIVGPSAGCPPDALFAAGVSAVGTAWVTDADAFLACLSAGKKWGASSRKVTLTPRHYPGLDTLLARAVTTR